MPLQLLPLEDALVGGKYRLGPVIGSGGVGTVHRAIHLWTEREVAIKILDPGLPHFDQLRGAFLREARATVQLQHPNVVDVLDMGEDDAHTTYLVMELLDGPTLRDVLLERRRLSPEDTFAILLPLIDALIKAHELGIVHRDFKPENIILSVDALEVTTPKLLDFGVAQVLRETRAHVSWAADDVIVGTPQYMSPEQARDQRELIGPHTDVWGVGVVWYECLTGRPPFDGDAPIEVLTSVCEAPIDFSEVPDAHVPILRDALRRSAAERIQSLAELRSRIETSGLVAPSTATRAKISSWPSRETRPSYVRRTLQGVGPSERLLPAPRAHRSTQLDSELLSLPVTSHRMALIGGTALAIALGLAAWWTIGRGGPAPVAPTTEPVAVEATAPAQPVAAPGIGTQIQPDTSAETEPQTGREPSTSAEAAPEASAARPSPRVKPDSPPSLVRSREQEQSSPSRPAYHRPPDLVTEW